MVRADLARRQFVLTLLGVLLLQAAWVLVVPPFRGLDEHDHAYKAAATADGDVWSLDREPSPQGWGHFMSVPRDLVEAATPVCEERPYTTPDNCRPGGETSPGHVRVASSAANYNPAMYYVLGTAARPFEGVGRLYAMRVAGSLMCAVMLALGLGAVRRLARGPFLPSAALLAMTPTVIYSTVVAAPNGLELASGFLVWTSLLCALSADLTLPQQDRWIRIATLGALLLVTLRALGPLWLLLIVTSVGVWVGWSAVARVLHRRNTVMCAAAVGVATILSASWIVAARPNRLVTSSDDFDSPLWTVLPEQWALWFFQSVAVIPARADIVPWAVYVMTFSAWAAVTAVAVGRAHRRQRMSLLLVFGLSTLIPSAATVYFYTSIGAAWQGRYTLPYAMGFLLLCGLVLDRTARLSLRWERLIVLVTAALVAVVAVISQLHVLRTQLDTSPLAGTDAWPAPAGWQVLTLTCAGMAMLVLTLLVERRRDVTTSTPGARRRGHRSTAERLTST